MELSEDEDDEHEAKRRRSSAGSAVPTAHAVAMPFADAASAEAALGGSYEDDEDFGNVASTSAPGYYGNASYDEDFSCSQTDNPPPPRTPQNKLQGHHAMQGDPLRRRHPKSIQDRVHGQIQLDGLLIAVMDTSEFQRLDRIKQLGGCLYVYPSATHTRKEHSIGVAYLSGYMARHLAETQPELCIDAADILCVELAGLTHDLGHGPFSHMFEAFMKQVEKEGETDPWEHENMSGKLLELLIKNNNIPVWDYFGESEGGDLWRQHISFAVKLISGLKLTDEWPTDIGRGPEKRFLFDIVSNARNSIDVDKLDYLARDAMACFGSPKTPGFDLYRIIKSSRVLFHVEKDSAGRLTGRRLHPEVCFQAKVALEISEMHTLRAKLHRAVYQHRIANVAEAMITDIFEQADKAFRLKGPQGQPMRLSETAHDVAAFASLTDSILETIDASLDGGLDAAHGLYERLKRRDFYRQVGRQLEIETLPRCDRCGAETPIEANFCSQCSRSTATRQSTRDKKGLHVPVTQSITEDAAAHEILERVQPTNVRDEIRAANALFVKIVKITHGKPTPKTDPHGKTWAVYDPLAHVGFYNPKHVDETGTMIEEIYHIPREKLPGITLPASYHNLTLYCFLRSEGPPSRVEDGARAQVPHELTWRGAVEKALDTFKKDRSLVEQHGTSNCPTPSHAALHGRSIGPTPRADRHNDRSRPPTAERQSQLASRASSAAEAGASLRAPTNLEASLPDIREDDGLAGLG